MTYLIRLLSITALVVLFTHHASAEDPLSSVQSVASEDLLAVAYLDVGSVDLSACLDWATKQEIVDPESAEEMKTMTGMGQEFLRQATKAGTDHVVALIHQEDLSFQGPPLLLFTVAKGKHPNKTFKALRRILGLIAIPDFKLEVWNDSILGGSPEQIARVKSGSSVERPNLDSAWQKFGGYDAGVMIFGSKDTRRVVKEMLPKLDSPFEEITGTMVAEKLTSGGIAIKLPADLDAKIMVQTTDSSAAETLKNAAAEIKKQLLAKESSFSEMVPEMAVSAMAHVDPEVQGNDVVIDLKPLLTDKVKLTDLLEPVVYRSRQTQQMNNLRQVMLAMLNYESAYKGFPTYANFDADGKPLLSWRVHILPFIEQNDLYQQFKLDEPWDSPHNIKLIEKMPPSYGDPSRKMKKLNAAGKTRFVLPLAEGTAFFGNEPLTFRDITDGSSNTIAVVCVPPENAVPWTQPVDWNVDMTDPKKGLFSDSNPTPIVVYCDGSVHILEENMLVQKLKALLTKAGGEIP